jgi:glycosyltransferase involved in cell wall biosynthesis
VIVYVGRLSAEKGLSLIAPIQRHLHRRGVAHRFVFVGDGPMRATLQRECPDGLFLGTMPHHGVGIPMASGDLFLFPSATDTFGSVVLEAQASGLPAIVSDRGGPRELVDTGVTGHVCPSHDAAAFAEAAIPLLRDAGRRAAMSQAARTLGVNRPWSEAVRPLFGTWA